MAAGLLALLCALFAFAPAAGAARPASVTIDFSQHGEGSLDRSYFKGVEFTEGSWVGYIQGDQALVGPVSGTAEKKFTSISASVAPATQGTATYTLTAYKGNGKPIASSSITVTQDTGDPQTGPWGYNTVTLAGLSKKATAFHLTNSFVRSSHSHITQIEFGVSSITLSR
jgi:hypothetical protein